MTTVDLKQLLALKEQREPLQEKLDAIDAQIEKLIGGSGTTPRVGLTRSPRVAVKDPVLTALRDAPADGFSINQLIDKTGLTRAAIDRFLYSQEAKAIATLRKVGEGRFRVVPDGDGAKSQVTVDHDHTSPPKRGKGPKLAAA